ncbi:fibronectin type III domain-containing protein [Piscinibacter terrae]|nr:fibronectin type III domain-containing protein [Albitalea terrae]
MRTNLGRAVRARVLMSLSVCFAAALTACGGGTDASSDTSAAQAEDGTANAQALAQRTIPTALPKQQQPGQAIGQQPITQQPVNQQPVATGTMTVSWAAPTTSADGLRLGDLTGYRVYYGTTSGSYTAAVDVPSATTLSATINGLPTATYFVVVKAYDSSNNESSASSEASLAVR